MREQDSPAVLDPLMPVHGAHGGLGLEVWHDIAEAQHLHTRGDLRANAFHSNVRWLGDVAPG